MQVINHVLYLFQITLKFMLSFKIGEKKLEKDPNDIYSGYHYRVLHEAKLGSNEITKAEKVQT